MLSKYTVFIIKHGYVHETKRAKMQHRHIVYDYFNLILATIAKVFNDNEELCFEVMDYIDLVPRGCYVSNSCKTTANRYLIIQNCRNFNFGKFDLVKTYVRKRNGDLFFLGKKVRVQWNETLGIHYEGDDEYYTKLTIPEMSRYYKGIFMSDLL